MAMKYDGAIYLDPSLGPENVLRRGRPSFFSWQDRANVTDTNRNTDTNTNSTTTNSTTTNSTNVANNNDGKHSIATNTSSKSIFVPVGTGSNQGSLYDNYINDYSVSKPISQELHQQNVAVLEDFADQVVLTDSPKHVFDTIASTNNPEQKTPSLLIAIDVTQYYTNHDESPQENGNHNNNSHSHSHTNHKPPVSARSIISQIYIYFHHLPISIVAISRDGAVCDVQLYSSGVDFVGPNPLKREILEATVQEKSVFLQTMSHHVDRIKLRVGLSDNKRRQNLLRHLVIDGRNDLQLLLQFDHGFRYSEADLEAARERIADWDYDPFGLSYDELVIMALVMFQYVLGQPGLEPYRLEEPELVRFLIMMRDAYHHENPYHNFRHAIDVMQATFQFLIRLGCLPPPPFKRAPNCSMIPPTGPAVFTPAESLVVLIAAIGHDISHPGVTNAFLVSSRSPMAQVFNDKSVLESYHACVLNRVLNIFWPATQEPQLKKLIVESVLATDMAQHFNYVDRWTELSTRCRSKGKGRCNEERGNLSPADRQLVGSMIMKCADVSNVTRRLDLAEQWGRVLQCEFSEVKDVETDCHVQTLPPNCGKNANLAQSQVSFLNIFAYPLFQQLSDAFPEFGYAFKTLQENKAVWESRLV
ncbi:cAMP-specific 3',5'-cyclic phosphodiesterase 4C [Yarrowia sp. C11]|nr:cAMP-specific 3',5'-cyclic phosphodiesterase 4C [Yarrowia sp. E02]KAG5367358.1 cAMP-specific 3',5'-cyclic phosphodiesterase 4C [Yarrowia sp. C11]